MKSAVQPLPITPGATLDIAWDWSAWLADGDTLSNQEVDASAGMTAGSSSINGSRVEARVSVPSNTATGTSLWARCKVTTGSGQTDSRKFMFIVKDR